MKTHQIQIALKDAQANLSELFAAVISNREAAVIVLPAGSEIALLAAEELSSLIETLCLLKSPSNATRLLLALNRAPRQ